SIDGNTQCADYFYTRHYSAKGDRMQALNALLAAKQNFDAGKDISKALDASLNQSTNPYAIYLKTLNEQRQGRSEEAAYWARRFMSVVSDSRYHSQLYSNLLGDMKLIIDPNYTPESDGVLSVVSELRLENCKLGQEQPFSLTLTNTGKSSLSVYDMRLSCTCVKLQSERTLTLQPGQSVKVDFLFIPDAQGEIFREIVFVSNGANGMERVTVVANVKGNES
ncbi:MAG: DUF1573 domain-containing protein, partial [Bacteroidales bacterium]|nr:DUF1573 domain-containing protein [Bacteroidales bacterium]